jgi:hypothetical protein
MRKTYLVVGLGALVAVAIAVPALGGATATDSSVKKTAKKALKTARKATEAANAAAAAAGAAQGDANQAQGSAKNALAALGGNRIVEINTRATSVPAGTPILQLNGLRLEGDCPSVEEKLVARTSVPDGEISSINTRASTGEIFNVNDDTFGPDDSLVLSTVSNSDRVYNINYTGGDGRNVMVQLQTEDDSGADDCLYTGFAIG